MKRPAAKPKPKARPQRRHVLLVTGLSGAGLSTAMKTLEDFGYKAFDNLPLSLVLPLLDQKEGQKKSIAIGIDSRTWDFSPAGLQKSLSQLKDRDDARVEVLFLDCDDVVLQKRFTETRRLHPLAADRPVRDGVQMERQLMKNIRRTADHLVDTTDYRPQDLRERLHQMFAPARGTRLRVSVLSFGFRNGLPREADLVFDVRFVDNPHWDPRLRPLCGLDRPVASRIRKDPAWREFFGNLTGLLSPLIPRYDLEGKSYLTVAIGCTGGRHRSVFTADQLHRWLVAEGHAATLRHRDLAGWTAQQGLPAAKPVATRKAKKEKTKGKKKK